MLFSKRITREPPPRNVDHIVILYVFSAIFNRVATGFILCFLEHFRVRRGLGWSHNKLKPSGSRQRAESEGLSVCITKTLLAPLRYRRILVIGMSIFVLEFGPFGLIN